MRAVEGLSSFVWIFWGTIRSLTSGRLYLPWLVLALLQGGLLFLLVNFLVSPLDRFMVPLVRILFGDRFFHFPESLLLLPQAFYYGNLLMGILAGSFLGGVAAYLFAGYFSGERPPLNKAISVAFCSYPSLMLLWALESLLFVLLLVFPRWMLSPLLSDSPRRLMVVQAASLALALVGVTFLAYAFISVVLSRSRILDSLQDSFRLAGSRFVSTFLFVCLPFLFRLPFDYLLLRPEIIVAKFNPYLVVYLLAMANAVSLVGSYLLVGNLTHLYQLSREESLRC